MKKYVFPEMEIELFDFADVVYTGPDPFLPGSGQEDEIPGGGIF